MEERPISSRMQELLQRAADERQADQDRHGETLESLRARFDELSAGVVNGNERLTEKIDATFALTASTVDILQRLADRVDSLEQSLDDITMRLGSISWRMDEVRDGEGRLANRIDESALALAEAMFSTGRARRPGSVGADDGRLGADGAGSATPAALAEPPVGEPATAKLTGAELASAELIGTEPASGELSGAEFPSRELGDAEPASAELSSAELAAARPATDGDLEVAVGGRDPTSHCRPPFAAP